jgi:hypothetical protein
VKSNSHHIILKNGQHSKKQSGHSQWVRIESRARLISLAVAAGGIFGSDGACYIRSRKRGRAIITMRLSAA